MRFGLIGDIHGNLEALERVLDFLLTREKVDKVIVLGDIVGYMANPNECVQISKEYKCIKGNHDFAVIHPERLDYFNPVAKEALIWTMNELTDENKAILKKLPLVRSFKEHNFTISHGTLRKPEEFLYLMGNIEAYRNFRLMKTQLLFVGHTHVPQYFVADKNSSMLNIKMINDIDYEKEIKLSKDNKYIFNIGSVGQPRDHNFKSCFVVYDSIKTTVKYIRLSYNVRKTAQKVIQNNLPTFLAKRILIGV